MAKRFGILLVTLAMVSLLCTSAVADEGSGRLQVDAFVGQVINNFSSDARKDYVNEEAADDNDIEFHAGLEFKYRLWSSETEDTGDAANPHSIGLFGEFIHSSRVLEAPCEDSNPDCQAQPNPDDFLQIIKDSSTVEWLGGVRWGREFDDAESEFFCKAQGGFIRAENAPDDVIDNHFVGCGVEHLIGRFAGSRFEAGWGRTDLFERDKRSERGKLGVVLLYTPGANDVDGNGDGNGDGEVMSFYMEGWLDSDLGPGSDDIQIYYGLAFDVNAIFEKLNK